jgi:hypothetical protein
MSNVRWWAVGAALVGMVGCSDGGQSPTVASQDGASGGNSDGTGSSSAPEGSGGSGTTAGGAAAGTGGAVGATGGTVGATGGAATGVGTGPSANKTVEQYCEQRIAMSQPWCDYVSRCCSAQDQEDDMFFVPTCTKGPVSLEECMTDAQTLLDKGAVWDGTWVDACVAGMAEHIAPPPASCSGLHLTASLEEARYQRAMSDLPACRNMVRGTRGRNQPCEYMNECEVELICNSASGDSYDDFACLPPLGAGATCVMDSQCQAGLFCVGLNNLTCGSLTGLGGDCLYASQCVDGLECSPTGSCVSPKGLGLECSVFEDVCEPGLGCGLSTDTCIALGAPGSSCSSSSNCDGRCDSASGRCTTICGGPAF